MAADTLLPGGFYPSPASPSPSLFHTHRRNGGSPVANPSAPGPLLLEQASSSIPPSSQAWPSPQPVWWAHYALFLFHGPSFRSLSLARGLFFWNYLLLAFRFLTLSRRVPLRAVRCGVVREVLPNGSSHSIQCWPLLTRTPSVSLQIHLTPVCAALLL